MDLLDRIKKLVREERLAFTHKARAEMDRDGLDQEDVEESILAAREVRSKRSLSPDRRDPGEMVHILEGRTSDGVFVYTKGVIRRMGGAEVFYVLVSAKRSIRDGGR